MQDDFDVDALRIDGKLDLTSTTKPSCRRVRTKETFARIPHERGLKLCGRIGAAAWVVLIELDRQIFKNHKNPIHLPNKNLEAVGMSRSTKKRALRQLQDAGVVIVEQQGHEATLVTHLWHPLSQ